MKTYLEMKQKQTSSTDSFGFYEALQICSLECQKKQAFLRLIPGEK